MSDHGRSRSGSTHSFDSVQSVDSVQSFDSRKSFDSATSIDRARSLARIQSLDSAQMSIQHEDHGAERGRSFLSKSTTSKDFQPTTASPAQIAPRLCTPPMPPTRPTKKHPRFYLDPRTVELLLDDGTLYRVFRHSLEAHSPAFAAQYLAGGADEGPIALSGVASVDLDCFLSLIYPEEIATPSLSTAAEWTSVLRLAHKWSFLALLQRAVEEVYCLGSVVDRIAVAREFGDLAKLQEWLLPAFVEACTTERWLSSVSEKEAERLGAGTVLKIARIREERASYDVKEKDKREAKGALYDVERAIVEARLAPSKMTPAMSPTKATASVAANSLPAATMSFTPPATTAFTPTPTTAITPPRTLPCAPAASASSATTTSASPTPATSASSSPAREPPTTRFTLPAHPATTPTSCTSAAPVMELAPISAAIDPPTSAIVDPPAIGTAIVDPPSILVKLTANMSTQASSAQETLPIEVRRHPGIDSCLRCGYVACACPYDAYDCDPFGKCKTVIAVRSGAAEPIVAPSAGPAVALPAEPAVAAPLDASLVRDQVERPAGEEDARRSEVAPPALPDVAKEVGVDAAGPASIVSANAQCIDAGTSLLGPSFGASSSTPAYGASSSMPSSDASLSTPPPDASSSTPPPDTISTTPAPDAPSNTSAGPPSKDLHAPPSRDPHAPPSTPMESAPPSTPGEWASIVSPWAAGEACPPAGEVCPPGRGQTGDAETRGIDDAQTQTPGDASPTTHDDAKTQALEEAAAKEHEDAEAKEREKLRWNALSKTQKRREKEKRAKAAKKAAEAERRAREEREREEREAKEREAATKKEEREREEVMEKERDAREREEAMEKEREAREAREREEAKEREEKEREEREEREREEREAKEDLKRAQEEMTEAERRAKEEKEREESAAKGSGAAEERDAEERWAHEEREADEMGTPKKREEPKEEMAEMLKVLVRGERLDVWSLTGLA